ncbi:TonB-dependent receptor [Alcaligenaceae bacterium]|nr:TonB-dependent receptor [Alcaligenaceae bacterium]
MPNSFRPSRFTVGAALCCLSLPALCADPVATLPTVTVTGEAATPLQPSVYQEQLRLDRVPGGTNLITPQTEIGTSTLRDVTDFQPGIIVQEFFGGIDQPRINIRGSGIQSNPVNRGVLLLQDGLPINEADGSFVIGLLEPRNASLISVRRGANALSAGATTLGGEMDFQSLIGTQGDVVSVEGGSFGRLGLHAAKGFTGDQLDGRFSISHDKSDGYRHHSDGERTNLSANFGVRGDNFENRTYLSYTDLKFDIPTVIPRDRAYSDPKSVMGDYPGDAPNVYNSDPNRKTRQLRLANRTYVGNEDLNQTFGVYWQSIDDTFTDPSTSTATTGNTWGAQWQLAGKLQSLDYRVALDWARSDMDRELTPQNPVTGNRMPRIADFDLKAENRSALLGLEYHLTPQLSLVGDLKYTQAIRDASNRDNGMGRDQKWSYASPKAGIVWKPADTMRWYANISRSNEAPTYWELLSGAAVNELDLQRATTYEIGGDGRLFADTLYPVNWAISLYHSNVDDELMEVADPTDPSGSKSIVYNYSDRTVHQGIEAGLNGSLPSPGAGKFDYRLAYTYSDFRFRGGEFDGNRIAGVPRHVLSAEILYRLGGWQIGPNVHWMPSDTYSDHMNTQGMEQKSYALLGFKVAYQHSKNWTAWVQADNLTDKTYVSSYRIGRQNKPAQPRFLPGNGRSISAGLKYQF